jgi:hypothetical protein
MPLVIDWIHHFQHEITEEERSNILSALHVLSQDSWLKNYYGGDISSLEYAIHSAQLNLEREVK